MNGAALSHALKKIPFLEQSDLIAAGVLDAGDSAGWMKFARDPHRAASALPADRIDCLASLLDGDALNRKAA